jgi:hypothetical protein
MGTLTLGDRSVEYQWATDVSFDGIRLEVLSDDGEMLFDVSIPDGEPTTVNTFGKEVPIDLMKLAIEVAERR